MYRFKKAWRDGTHAVVLSPEDFIAPSRAERAQSARRASGASRARRARVCALVPPPRLHLMRYLGVLAGHSSLLAEVVPKKLAAPPKQLPLFDERDEPTTSAKSAVNKTAEPSRHPWPWLPQRVFAVDILVCERCGGRLRHALAVLGSLGSPCARSARGGGDCQEARRRVARTARARLGASTAPGAACRRVAGVRARAAQACVRVSSSTAQRAR